MSAAALRVPALAPYFKEQELANIVWAYAKLRVSNEQVFHPLLAQARGKLPNFMPQVCWGAACYALMYSLLKWACCDHLLIWSSSFVTL